MQIVKQWWLLERPLVSVLHHDCNPRKRSRPISGVERGHESPVDIRNIHGFKVTLVIRLPALGIADIAMVSSAMVGAILENGAGQGRGTGRDRSNRGSAIIVIIVILGELWKDTRLG